MKKLSMLLCMIVILFTATAFVSGAQAAPPEGTTRPGWGFGDKNHIHVGPPGKSVLVTQDLAVSPGNVNSKLKIQTNDLKFEQEISIVDGVLKFINQSLILPFMNLL